MKHKFVISAKHPSVWKPSLVYFEGHHKVHHDGTFVGRWEFDIGDAKEFKTRKSVEKMLERVSNKTEEYWETNLHSTLENYAIVPVEVTE